MNNSHFIVPNFSRINMHFFKSLALGTLAALPLVSPVAVDLHKRDSDISVTLSSVEHAVVKASVKNNGAEALSLLKAGSFLDAAPVFKATVFKDGLLPTILDANLHFLHPINIPQEY